MYQMICALPELNLPLPPRRAHTHPRGGGQVDFDWLPPGRYPHTPWAGKLAPVGFDTAPNPSFHPTVRKLCPSISAYSVPRSSETDEDLLLQTEEELLMRKTEDLLF